MKKYISLFLALLMVFTLLPVSALADGETTGAAEAAAESEPAPEPEITPEPETTPEPEATPEPEITPEPETTPELKRVAVRFSCTPEEAAVLVYEAENDEVELEPEEDGSYRLAPGTYVYVAFCEGYVSIFEELVIEDAGAETNEEKIIDVVLEPAGEADEVVTYASEDYRTWLQTDSRWSSLPLGSGGAYVYDSGCLVTATTKLIIQSGLKSADSFDVATYVNYANNNGGFTGSNMYYNVPDKITNNGFVNQGDILSYSSYSSTGYNDTIISYIKQGHHMVLQVNSGDHWIAVDEAKSLATGTVYIMDSVGNPAADLTLASRYSTFNTIHSWKGGTTPSGTPQKTEEQKLRDAIANGETSYTSEDDITLTENLTIPAGFTFTLNHTLTVPNSTVFQNYGELYVGMNGVLYIPSGGAMRNYGNAEINGIIKVYGTYYASTNSTQVITEKYRSCTASTLGNLDSSVFDLVIYAHSTDRLSSAASMWYYKSVNIYLQYSPFSSYAGGGSTDPVILTLPSDLVIHDNTTLHIEYTLADHRLTVPRGIILENHGRIELSSSSRQTEALRLSINGNLMNYGTIESDYGNLVCNGGCTNDGGESICTVRTWAALKEVLQYPNVFNTVRYSPYSSSDEYFQSVSDDLEIPSEVTLEIYTSLLNVTANVYNYGIIKVCRGIFWADHFTNYGLLVVSQGAEFSLSLKDQPYYNFGNTIVEGTFSSGSVDGNRIRKYPNAKLSPTTLPHFTLGVLVDSVTFIGPDTVKAGSTTSYGYSVLPNDAYYRDVTFAVVGGDISESASFYENTSALDAGTQPGTVYIQIALYDYDDNLVYATKAVTVEPLVTEYTVSYDANGGTGAPSAQTKKYGTALTLSSTKPSRTGYTFLGWATSKTAASAQYQPGGSYTANAAVTLYAVWQVNTYTVSYDANGGTGAPSAQTKKYGTALTLSSTKPSRTGYTFLGWAASKTATSAQYQPGGSYTANAAVTLYAVWQQDTPAYATSLTISKATASQGKEVSLDISIAGNTGLAAISFQITYDKTRLKLSGYEDGGLKDWAVSVGESDSAVWLHEEGSTINGSILTLKFQVLEEAEDGLASVTLSNVTAVDKDENIFGVSIVAGGVTVTNRIPGDINGDGVVNVVDCLRLKKYLAGFKVTIVEQNADVTGDGAVNVVDCLRLKKYLAGFKVELK